MIAKHRRNFLPTFILNILLWLAWFYVVFRLSPSHSSLFRIHNSSIVIPASLIYFFLTLLPALTLTFGFLFSSTRRGLMISLAISIFLILRLLKQAHPLNLVLLLGIIGCLEVYFSKRE